MYGVKLAVHGMGQRIEQGINTETNKEHEMLTREELVKRAIDLNFNYRKDQELICLIDQILNIQAMLELFNADQLRTLDLMLNMSVADGLDDAYKASLQRMIVKALNGDLS
jgi:hypothetical protein